jgi:hypothetical protein
MNVVGRASDETVVAMQEANMHQRSARDELAEKTLQGKPKSTSAPIESTNEVCA